LCEFAGWFAAAVQFFLVVRHSDSFFFEGSGLPEKWRPRWQATQLMKGGCFSKCLKMASMVGLSHVFFKNKN
jgi:hypothetical protein